jgi:chemotaxis family two-component system sensor kinase Cph1
MMVPGSRMPIEIAPAHAHVDSQNPPACETSHARSIWHRQGRGIKKLFMIQDREELRDFLLRACHDLRSPLRAVTVHAELLQRAAEKNGDLEQNLTFVTDGARTMNSLVDALARYALSLQVEPSPAPVSTAALLRSVLAKSAPEIQASGAEVTYGDLPRVSGDPDRLMQLLEDLLRNAIRHSEGAPPRIHISARAEEGEWIFAVRDEGPGLDPRDLERIFRPFERLGRGNSGSGLGLASCREIVIGHGGRIWAESRPGEGTAILFTLPRSEN